MKKRILLSSTAVIATAVGVYLYKQTSPSTTSIESPHLSMSDRMDGKEIPQAEIRKLLAEIKSELSTPKKGDPSWLACNLDEDRYLKIESDLLFPFFQALQNGKASEAQKYLVPNAQIQMNFFGSESQKGGYDTHSWSAPEKSDLQKALSSYSEIADLSFETLNMSVKKEDRDAKDQFQKALLRIELDIRGTNAQSRRMQSSGTLLAEAQLENDQWKISSLKLESGLTVLGRKEGPSFAKVSSDKAFQGELKSYLRREAIRRGGYAMAVGDFNNDKSPDIFVGNMGPSQLFQGNGNGTFSPVTGVPDDLLVKSAAFIDFENSGKQDLLVVKFIPEENVPGLRGTSSVSIYKNLGNNKFERIENPILSEGLGPLDRAMPAAVADFDNDGHLDFYIGYPGIQDFTHAASDKSTGAHGLYFGDGSGRFTPLAKENFEASFVKHNRGYPHSALAVDYNNDNKVDLLVVDDRAGLSTAFTNLGDRKFNQEAEEIGLGNNGYGMAIAAADLNNDGILDLVLTNVEVSASQRILNSCYQSWDAELPLVKERALRVFLGTAKAGFQEVNPSKVGLAHPGYGLSGVRFVDFDNDGQMDLYVTNGLWSGTDRTQKFDSIYTRSRSQTSIGAQQFLQRSQRSSASSIYMDVLSFFKGDLFDGKKEARPSLAGFQRNRLYKNLGGEFMDVGYLEGVDSVADGYMVATADLTQSGRSDLVLRNADPGSTDVRFETVEVFLNQNPNKNSLTLQLVGTKSNRDAIGAKVEVITKSGKQLQHVIALDGTVQASKVLHFGLGTASQADQVKIRWPSGREMVLRNLQKGYHMITEPGAVMGEASPQEKGKNL